MLPTTLVPISGHATGNTMIIHAGFEIKPRVTNSSEDTKAWKSFISKVKSRYFLDPLIESKNGQIIFKTGDHPKLPIKGDEFVNFISTISDDSKTEGVLKTVAGIARKHFREDRVHWWQKEANSHDVPALEKDMSSLTTDAKEDAPLSKGKSKSNSGTDMSSQPSVKKEESLQTSTTASRVPESSSTANVSTPELFKIEDIPKKGKGMIATCDIAPGTLIISEKPLFIHKDFRTHHPASVVEASFQAALDRIPITQQRQYLELANTCPPDHPPLAGIWSTNGIPCGPDSEFGAVYAIISRINHSCRPNGYHNWNDETKCETIYAIRPIAKGEEITISYGPLNLPRINRLRHLYLLFNFTCECPLCSLPADEVGKSDERIMELNKIYESIENSTAFGDPPAFLKACYRMHVLVEEEYEGTYHPDQLGRPYNEASAFCSAHGDQARASVFKEKAYKLWVLAEGEDSPSSREAKMLMEDPTRFPLFGLSKLWKTRKRDVPKGLSEKEFEKWLWKLEE